MKEKQRKLNQEYYIYKRLWIHKTKCKNEQYRNYGTIKRYNELYSKLYLYKSLRIHKKEGGKMNYATIKDCDVANGPGVRVSLFVSGCNHHCKGCFN